MDQSLSQILDLTSCHSPLFSGEGAPAAGDKTGDYRKSALDCTVTVTALNCIYLYWYSASGCSQVIPCCNGIWKIIKEPPPYFKVVILFGSDKLMQDEIEESEIRDLIMLGETMLPTSILAHYLSSHDRKMSCVLLRVHSWAIAHDSIEKKAKVRMR